MFETPVGAGGMPKPKAGGIFGTPAVTAPAPAPGLPAAQPFGTKTAATAPGGLFTAAAPAAAAAFGTPAAAPVFGTPAAAAAPTAPAAAAAAATTPFGAGLPKTAAAPANIPFGVGAKAGAPMAAPLVAAAAAPPLTPAKKPPSDPIEYKEMERKLNQWKSEISKKRQAFTDQSVKVKEWDNALVRNNEQIMKLQKEVNNVKVHQHRLSEQLKGIKSHQETIRAVVQEHAKKAAEVPQPPPDEGREQTYKMAENINSQLVHASGDLNEIIKGLNAQEVDSAQDDAVDDMARISKILGAHVDTLSWVEKRTDTLNTRIVALESSRQQIAYPNQPMQGFQ